MSRSIDNEIRVGVVGCGVVASAYYLPHLMTKSDVRVAGLCDRNELRALECKRLFGAEAVFADYYEMLERADLDLVYILTGPGTHHAFTLAAVERGLHVVIQKPMALTLDQATEIADEVRARGVKAIVEPSSNTVLEQPLATLRDLIARGALGDPYWFSFVPIGPDHPHPSLSGNPYGARAFYTKDSGGMLFDYPYGPSQIVTLLGDCRSVSGSAKICVPDRAIVPDSRYDEYLQAAHDPQNSNYWTVVVDEPRTQRIRMAAPDNVFCLLEMDAGWTGVFHVGRLFQPMIKGAAGGGLEIFGTEGNVIFGRTPPGAPPPAGSIYSTRRDLLPSCDEDGWYHIPAKGDFSKARWPIPIPGGFNYYHESTNHMLECIREDKDPVPNVEWGRHITEIMYGTLESARTGRRYEMKTTTIGLRVEGS